MEVRSRRIGVGGGREDAGGGWCWRERCEEWSQDAAERLGKERGERRMLLLKKTKAGRKLERQGADQTTIKIDEFDRLLRFVACSRGRTRPDGTVTVARKGPLEGGT